MDDNKEQIIYINMDDSGQLVQNNKDELVFTYGGIFFLSLEEQNDFSRQYKALVNKIKPKYCPDYKINDAITENFCATHNYNNCNYRCPELKSNMLRPKDRRRLLNFIKRYNTSVAVVSNHQLRDAVFNTKASKGRYKDYVIRREVKEIIKNLIYQNKINPKIPVRIILNLDEQTTISNGYYSLAGGIKEELQFGISNFDYGIFFEPILSKVNVQINYKNSYYNFPVQAADLLVGEVRHAYYNFLKTQDFEDYQKRVNFLNTSLYLP